MAKEPLFSDIDPELKKDQQGNILMVEDTDAINASLENIFMISPGEMVMDPLFGAELSKLVGARINDNSAAFIRMLVSKALDSELRVRTERLDVTPKPDDGAFLVVLHYRLNVNYIQGVFERLVVLE